MNRVATCALFLLAVKPSACADVYAISAADNKLYSVLTADGPVNVTDTLPINGTSWGRGIVSSCLDGKRLFTFASGLGDSPVVLAGVSVNGSGSIVTFTTPFPELSSVWMMGMFPPAEPEGTGCTFVVVGRVSPTSDWQLATAGIQQGRTDTELMAAEGGNVDGTYQRDLEGPGTYNVDGTAAYLTLSRLEEVNGSQEYRTWAVTLDGSHNGPIRVGFCLLDWKTETGRNLDTMDYDASRGVVVGMGMNGSSPDGDTARVLVSLKIAPALQPRPLGVAADHLNSRAAVCEWTAGPPMFDHPIDIGGLSALIDAGSLKKPSDTEDSSRAPPAAPKQQLLVYLGSAPMSATTDAVVVDASTGQYVTDVPGVCTDPSGRCYTVMGAG